MTTVFADAKAGVMVCDSKCTSDSTWFPMTKVRRVGVELVGIAGNVKDAAAWVEWYMGGKKGGRPKLDTFSALILRAEGVFDVSADGFEQLVERGYHGIGSGGGYAVAAFKAGAKPQDAVRIACDIDVNSGGDVIVHRLKA
jgi:ATP-dependent protease HslVU (ClpYQ) peptidase subunit